MSDVVDHAGEDSNANTLTQLILGGRTQIEAGDYGELADRLEGTGLQGAVLIAIPDLLAFDDPSTPLFGPIYS